MKIKTSYLIISLIIIVSVLGNVFNAEMSLFGIKPNAFNFVVSLAFVLSWIIASVYFGRKRYQKYMIFVSFYFWITIIQYILAIILNENIGLLLIVNPEITILIPINGILQFVMLFHSSLVLYIICLIVFYVFVLVSYFISSHKKVEF